MKLPPLWRHELRRPCPKSAGRPCLFARYPPPAHHPRAAAARRPTGTVSQAIPWRLTVITTALLNKSPVWELGTAWETMGDVGGAR